MSQCQDAAETGCAPVARGWEQGVEEEEDVMLELNARKLFFSPVTKSLRWWKLVWKQNEHWQSKKKSEKYDVIVPFLSSYALDSEYSGFFLFLFFKKHIPIHNNDGLEQNIQFLDLADIF